MPLISAGVSGVTSIIGGMQAAKASEAAQAKSDAFMNQAIAELEKVGIPTVEAQKIALETPELVFDYAPQLEQQFPDIKSEMTEVTVDPRLESAQAQALAGMSERAEMGLTPEEEAEINALRRETAQQNQAQQATILQQMEQRGMGGSGAQLAAQLASSQGSAQTASEESDRLAAMQFQAKQEALAQLGTMATDQRTQQVGEDVEKASAADLIAQYNQEQQSGVQQRNIASQNAAQLQTQEINQDLESQRAATANTEEQYNKELQQQEFENKMTKSNATTGILTGAAQNATNAGATEAANKTAMWSGIGQAASGAVGTLGK